MTALKVFISYARGDGMEAAALIEQHLKQLQSEEFGPLEILRDASVIRAGAKFQQEARKMALEADVVIAVLSTLFYNSDWCTDERDVYLPRVDRGEALLLPVAWIGTEHRHQRWVKDRIIVGEDQPLASLDLSAQATVIDQELVSEVRRVLQERDATSQPSPRPRKPPSSGRSTPSPLLSARSNSLSEFLCRYDHPESFEEALVGLLPRPEPRQDVIKATDALKAEPVLYFDTIIKRLWRFDLLNAEFFAWLQRRQPDDPTRHNKLERLESNYRLAFPGAPHKSAGDGDDDPAGFLDRMLFVPEYGVVLKPNDVAGHAMKAFELSSGRIQEEFVTSWELYDEPEELKICVDALAAEVVKLLQIEAFSSLVTCTATSRHLVEYIQSRLAASASSEIVAIHFLTPEMTLDIDTGAVPNLRNQRVLIVTDVVASMTLVDELANAVIRFGGEVAGAIATVYVGDRSVSPSMIEIPIRPKDPVPVMPRHARFRVVRAQSKGKISLYALAHYPIKAIPHDKYDRDERFQVDPSTILPVQQEQLGKKSDPLFDNLGDMIERLDGADALRFGLYRSYGRIVTAALRFSRVIHESSSIAEEIRQRIRAYLDRSESITRTPEERAMLRVVTTHRQDDVDFADFVQGIIGVCDAQRVHLPRREGTRSPNPFVVMDQKVGHLRGCNVLLVLAAVDTSDHLRAMVSLLTSAGARSVQVLCLLSRMRFYSTNFLSRIDGIEPVLDQDARLRVHFKTVFELPEIEHTVLWRMVTTLEQVAEKYRNSPASPALHRLAANEFKHFKPVHLTSRSFEGHKTVVLHRRHPLHTTGASAFLSTIDGLLFTVTRDLTAIRAKDRDGQRIVKDRESPRRVIRLLADYEDVLLKRQAYQLFALLLGDLSYLRKIRPGRGEPMLQRLRDVLYRGWRRHRSARELGGDKLEQHATLEVQYLLLLAIFSAVDQYADAPSSTDPFYRDLFGEAVEGLVGEDKRLTEEGAECLTRERLVLGLSILFHLRLCWDCDPETEARVRDAKRTLNESVRGAITRELASQCDGTRAEKLRLAKARVETILYDLGDYRRASRARIIRHLHANLFGKNHERIPYDRMLQQIPDIIAEKFDIPSDGRHTNGRYMPLRDSSETDEIKRRLEDSLLACDSIEQLASNARDLFLFAGSVVEDEDRILPFVAQRVETMRKDVRPSSLDLRSAVYTLSELLYAIRHRPRLVVSRVELSELRRLCQRIRDLLSAPALRDTLFVFVVPLGRLFQRIIDQEQPLKDARDLLVPIDERLHVLCDRILLEDLLTVALFAATEQASRRVHVALYEEEPTGADDPKLHHDPQSASWVQIWIGEEPIDAATYEELPGQTEEIISHGVSWLPTLIRYARKLKTYDGRAEVRWNADGVLPIDIRITLRTRSHALAKELGQWSDL